MTTRQTFASVDEYTEAADPKVREILQTVRNSVPHNQAEWPLASRGPLAGQRLWQGESLHRA